MMLFDLAIHLETYYKSPFIHSRYKKNFYRLFSKAERERRHRRIPRCALLSPNDSPWRRVYESRSDQALITMTGLDFNKFESVYYEEQKLDAPTSKSGMVFSSSDTEKIYKEIKTNQKMVLN